MPKVLLFKKVKQKICVFLLLFLNTKFKHSSFASKQTGKVDRSGGEGGGGGEGLLVFKV